MLIGAFQKFSMIDYPEKLSAVVFFSGCNLRCPYCHNPQLCLNSLSNYIEMGFVLDFLVSRVGKLDAIVLSGGEPTMQENLIQFVRKVKELGYLVKLDTNGTKPDVIKQLLDEDLLDYVAMDVKTTEEKFKNFSDNIDFSVIKTSIDIIMSSKIDYEFRTTLINEYHKEDKITHQSYTPAYRI